MTWSRALRNLRAFAYFFSILRYLLASVNSKKQTEMDQVRTHPVTMIVAEKLTAKMTKTLPGILALYRSRYSVQW